MLRLLESARLTTDEYEAAGNDLLIELVDDEIRLLTAEGDGSLNAEDVQILAPFIRVEFEDGLVHRLIAIGTADGPPGTAQARAISADFFLTADSIDALAPGQQLERVFAMGSAYGVRLTEADGPANDWTPAAEGELVLDRDWLRGDTIRAYFTDAPAAVPDGGEMTRRTDLEDPAAAPQSERILERLVAVGVGTPASTIHRIPDGTDPTAPPAIAYMVAREIRVLFDGGEVRRVEADDETKGLYLQPAGTVVRQTANPQAQPADQS
jgi:hypothetical protein